MIRISIIILILLYPLISSADYKIYLKDGTTISGVNFYREEGSDIKLYFDSGSMVISGKDVLKIEGKESLESDNYTEEVEEKAEDIEPTIPEEIEPKEPTSDKSEKIRALLSKIDAVNKEIRATEIEETKLVAEINEKTSNKKIFNYIQMRQLEMEVEPLRKKLVDIQQKKLKLLKKRASLEEQFRALE